MLELTMPGTDCPVCVRPVTTLQVDVVLTRKQEYRGTTVLHVRHGNVCQPCGCVAKLDKADT